MIDAFNGDGDDADRALLKDHAMRETIAYRDRMFELEGFGLRQLALWYGPMRQRWLSVWNDGPLRDWFEQQDPAEIDLRTIDALLRKPAPCRTWWRSTVCNPPGAARRWTRCRPKVSGRCFTSSRR